MQWDGMQTPPLAFILVLLDITMDFKSAFLALL
jgi:hypothetical protein